MARDHHFHFAKRLIPTHAFQSTDKVFAELTGPKREAFLMFLWQEAGKQAGPPLPHVEVVQDAAGSHVAKLEVVGALKPGPLEVVVLSLPPAKEPNEAAFLALVRRPDGVSAFFLERCMDRSGAGVSPSEAVLAEMRSDGSRVNHGFQDGVDLAAFKRRLGAALGVSLDGLETSLPPITMAAFTGAEGRAPAGTGKGTGVGGLLATLLLVRAALPLVLRVVGQILPMALFPLLRFVYTGLALAIGLLLLIWLVQVHRARQLGRSPAMAVIWWIVPAAQLFMPAVVVHNAYKKIVGQGGGVLVAIWWVCWLFQVMLTVVDSFARAMALPPALMEVLVALSGVPMLVIAVTAYGLLFVIVRSIESKL